jgi:molecular chaperone GrpE
MTNHSDPAEAPDMGVADAPQDAAAAGAASLPAEPDVSAVRRLEDEVALLNERHLRLAAEYDNYRKRAAREKAELSDRAQATLAGRLLDALDDLHRAVTSDPASTPLEALRGAIQAVDMKVWKELQGAGLERIDPVGERFDPAVHEAVSLVAAPEAGREQTVAATFQAGYRFRGVLVRPARVQVYAGPGDA